MCLRDLVTNIGFLLLRSCCEGFVSPPLYTAVVLQRFWDNPVFLRALSLRERSTQS